MKKKISKIIVFSLIMAMFVASTSYANETIHEISYEEYIDIVEDSPEENYEQKDLTPVVIETDNDKVANETPNMQESDMGDGDTETHSLSSNVTGKDDISFDASKAVMADNVSIAMPESEIATMTIPVAGLIPIIMNEETLINGEISTDTWIAFLFNDSDADGDDIVQRYVGGNAANFIIGMLTGDIGFVVQCTVPGTYQLLYQVEDSAGEFSQIIRFNFDVVTGLVNVNNSRSFNGSFTSANDSITYNVSIDFSTMDAAAFCIVRTGYVGARMYIYNENGTLLGQPSISDKLPKSWFYLDKPAADAAICNYTIVTVPENYSSGASNFRITVGNKQDAELHMSGIENTVLLERYYESLTNFINMRYQPNRGEAWFKFSPGSFDVITVMNYTGNVRFQIRSVNNSNFVMYDSANNPDDHKTKFLGSSWTSAEKARLLIPAGGYYLVLYSTNPKVNVALDERSCLTAVGNPVMGAGNIRVYPGSTVTALSSGYSSSTFSANLSTIPETAQAISINFSGGSLSSISGWRVMPPNKSSWTNSLGMTNTIDLFFMHDWSSNARVKGVWDVGFKSSLSTSYSFTPSYSFSYWYEYGDI